MTIETKSMFAYGIDVDASNSNIYFDEGNGEILSVIPFGTYTLESYARIIAETMSSNGVLNYGYDFDKVGRTIDIHANGLFDILVISASGDFNFAKTAGFVDVEYYGQGNTYGDGSIYGNKDFTGLTLYRSKIEVGSTYTPQFILQSYIDEKHERALRFASSNESSSGVIETISFGKNKFFSFNIKYATNRIKTKNNHIDRNDTGVEDLESFMDYIIERKEIEFFPDRDDLSISHILVLERAVGGGKGTGFKLKEVRNAPNYFETGVLKFRKLEN